MIEVFLGFMAITVVIFLIIVYNYHRKTNLHKKSLQGQVVLVTGSANGLGRSISLAFAEERCHVVCVDRDTEHNEELIKEILKINDGQFKAKAYNCDVSDVERVRALRDEVLKDFKRVDILVNNAGVAYPEQIMNLTDEHVSRLYDVNVLGNIWMIRSFLPQMLEKKRGLLISIASIVSRVPIGGLSPYTSTKFAVYGLMQAMDQELRQMNSGVKTLTVFPGCMSTALMPVNLRKPGLFWIDGRLPLEILKTKRVAKKIILAVKEERKTLYAPEIYEYLAKISDFLPSSVFAWIIDFINVNKFIDDLIPCK